MNPQTLALLRKYLTWRTCKRVTVTVCVIAIACAAGIYHQSRQQSVPPVCGVGLQYDPFAVRAFRLADKSGNLIARLLTEPLPSDETFAEYLFGTADVMRWWLITLTNPIRGAEHFAGIPEGGGAGANPYGVPVPCTPPGEVCEPEPTPADPSRPPVEPPAWDPKNASLQGLGAGQVQLTGPELAADALRRAGFPADEIPTFVAIAEHETGFRNISGPTVGGGTMRGMWQLNDRYWKLDNWQDPYANAVMAKRVRDESVKAGRGPYYPWSTWRAAVRDAGRYARFGTTPKAPETPPAIPLDPMTGTPVDCTPAAGGVGGTVGTWNVWHRNSTSRINAGAGFADLVGLQEIRNNSAIDVPGYGVTEGKMAVPIIWRLDKLDLIKWGRETVLKGYERDKSAVWGIWRNKATGQTFAAINTHMLVQGGTGWQKQAANVNRIRKRLQGQGYPVVLVGDMNANAGKIQVVLGGKPVGHHIDFAIGYGMKPTSHRVLSKFGSDHARQLFAFPAAVKTPPATSPAGGVPADFDQQGNPRSVEQAITWLKAHPNGAPGERVRGRCERWMNLSFGRGGGYASAIAHWNAAGPKHTEGEPPRGALVFWGPTSSNPYGHVALSVGGGRVISTDFDGSGWAPGRISEGPISSVKFGALLGWRAPNFEVGSGK